MIDLQENLSEFSYGYGVINEVQRHLEERRFRVAPFLPSLRREAALGIDVAFDLPGGILAFQFKLGKAFERPPRRTPLNLPCWKYDIDTNGHQFQRLSDLERDGAKCFYIAPQFAEWLEYAQYFIAESIIDNSLIVKPSDIINALRSVRAHPGRHNIEYDYNTAFICSDPTELSKVSAQYLREEMPHSLSSDKATLGEYIEHMYKRRIAQGQVNLELREGFFARATIGIEEMANFIAYEAWSAGIQMIFVSAPGRG